MLEKPRVRTSLHVVARVTQLLLGLVFVLSTWVQHNDPDPIPWMLVYGSAALLCFVGAARAAVGNVVVGAAVVLGLVAGAWACTRLSAMGRFFASDRPPLAFHMKTDDTDEEEAREGGGLALVVGAAGLMVVRRRSA